MNRLLLALLCFALACGAGIAVWLAFGNESAAESHLTSRDLSLSGAPEAAAPGPEDELGTSRSDQRSGSAAIVEPDPVTGEVLDDVPRGIVPSSYVSRAYLIGRIVDKAGKPIGGMDLRLLGKVANQRRKEAWPGDLAAWKHLERRTDGNGRFAFAFRPLPPLEFTLETRDPRFLTWRKRWKEIEPGSRTELGDIVLARGGTLFGSVSDQNGDAIAGGWELELQPKGDGDLERIRRDPDTKPPGTFRVAGVSQGKWTASIRFRRGLPEGGEVRQSPEGEIEMKEGEEKQLLFTYVGPPLRSSISLDVKGAKTGEMPLAEHVRLIGGSAGVQIAGESGKPVSDHTWTDLSWSTYTIQIDDPRFKVWRKEGLKPSPAPVEARVTGSSSLVVKAYAARDGKPVTHFGVKVKPIAKPPTAGDDPETDARRQFDGLGLENLTTLTRDKEQIGGVARLDGLIAGDWVLIVDSKDYTRGEIEVRGLSPNESREVEVRLSKGAIVAGVVIGPDGKTPIEGASVLIEPYGASTDTDQPMGRMASRFRSMKKDSRHATMPSDAQGRFAFDNMEPGTYTVRAKYEIKLDNMLGMMDYFGSGGAGLVAVKDGINAGDRELVEDVVLTLPAGAYFRGRLLAPPKADFKDVNLRLRSAGSEEWDAEMSIAFRVDEEGRFEVGPLRPGPAKLIVILFDEEDLTSFGRMQQRELGEYVLSAGDSGLREIDVRDIWPGKVHVKVTRGGAPVEGARVSIAEAGSERRGFGRFSGERTNAEGVVALESVFAGALEVSVSKDDWTIKHPGTVFLAPGGEAEVELRVMLHPGTLEVVDKATQKPLSNRSFFLREVEGGGFAERPVRTDEHGRIRLELADGTYELVSFDDFGEGRPRRAGVTMDVRRVLDRGGVRIQWGSTGPVPAKIELELEPEKSEKAEEPPDPNAGGGTPPAPPPPGGGGRRGGR